MIKRIVFFVVLLISLGLLRGLAGDKPDNYILIVNKANPVEQITTQELRIIYLGKKLEWSPVLKIEVCALEDREINDAFLKRWLNMDYGHFLRHWKRLTFTGTGPALRLYVDQQEMMDFIRETPGAIGYISPKNMNDKVKRIHLKY